MANISHIKDHHAAPPRAAEGGTVSSDCWCGAGHSTLATNLIHHPDEPDGALKLTLLNRYIN